MIETTGEGKSAVTTPDGKSGKKQVWIGDILLQRFEISSLDNDMLAANQYNCESLQT